MASTHKPVDMIFRGEKKPSPGGTVTLVVLRSLGATLQLALLVQPYGWGVRPLSTLGLRAVPSAAVSSAFSVPLLFGLGTLPLPHQLLALMSFASAAKVIWWQTCVGQEYFPVSNAIFVATYNNVMDSLSSLLFLCATTSSMSPSRLFGKVFIGPLPLEMIVGSALFVLGLGMEIVGEAQRRAFKAKSENQGKLFRGGLWSVTRHPNYAGYALWRAGYGLAAGGWLTGLAMGAWSVVDFVTRGIPAIEQYCAERYGQQWVKYEKEVKTVLLPGLY